MQMPSPREDLDRVDQPVAIGERCVVSRNKLIALLELRCLAYGIIPNSASPISAEAGGQSLPIISL
jgi:hypothetical protein